MEMNELAMRSSRPIYADVIVSMCCGSLENLSYMVGLSCVFYY